MNKVRSLREKMMDLDRRNCEYERRLNKKNVELGAYPQQLSMPIGVQFELTAKCNMFCKHCYNNSYLDRKSEMKTSDWLNVVDDINENGGVFQCILSGGEPLLLGKDLYRIMDPLHAVGTAFVIITNGYLVNEQVVEKLKSYDYYWVQVSIDHLIPEKHDEFRGKQGSWKKAVNAALSFSAAGFPLRIAHSLTPESLEYLPDFVEFCYTLGASSVVCGEILLSGRVNDNRDLLMHNSDYERMYKIINQLELEYSGRMKILRSASEAIEMRHHQQSLNSSVIIRPDGSVRLDCTMPFSIGNVLEQKFSDIWREKGNTCWNDSRVDSYIKDIESNGFSTSVVNHITPDIKI